jgi:hypothetical protein
MTQAERDRLVALKKAKRKLITQKLAVEGWSWDRWAVMSIVF